jgi:polysaccharide biosynthesis protein PslH
MDRMNNPADSKPASDDVLVLSYWNLNAPSFGGARRIAALLAALGDRAIVCQPGPAHPRLRSHGFRPDLGRRKRGINWGLFNFFVPTTAHRVRRLLRRCRPALVVVTSIWAYWPLRRLKHRPPVVLDAHDVLAGAIEERFGARHPFTRLVAAWEGRVVRSVEHVFACSDLDWQQFVARYGISPERVSTVPNGVDMAGWQSEPEGAVDADVEAALQGATVLFFMGKLDYQPNREALQFLARQLMPALERDPGGVTYRLLVCGGPAPATTPHPAIVLTGRVPDVAPCVRRADICLAPIFTGSGTRLKILEYMAAGKPVVSTPKGAEGIAGASGVEFELVEAADFATAVRRLAADPAAARRMGEAGRRRVAQQYDWRTIRQGWERVFRELAG